MLVGILIGGFIILIFGIVGAVMIYKYFQEKKEAEKSQSWPSTSGSITKSFMRHEVSYESGNTLYYPNVEYDYEVLGTAYTGNRINFGGSTGNSNRKKSEEILTQYPLGKNVPVYYDSNNPEDAVLEREIGVGGTVFLVVGLLFILIILCALCISTIIAGSMLVGY
jgi:hypothetical protein